MRMSNELDKLVRIYKSEPSYSMWVRINIVRRREGLPLVDQELNEEPIISEFVRLEEDFKQSRNYSVLQVLNKKREEKNWPYLDEDLLPIEIDAMTPDQFKKWVGVSKSFYEAGPQLHRGTFEPSENRPSWGLSVDEFTQISCGQCNQLFKKDSANGVVDGIMIVDTAEGKLYFHGYPDTNAQNTSCYAKAMEARRKAWEEDDD